MTHEMAWSNFFSFREAKLFIWQKDQVKATEREYKTLKIFFSITPMFIFLIWNDKFKLLSLNFYTSRFYICYVFYSFVTNIAFKMSREALGIVKHQRYCSRSTAVYRFVKWIQNDDLMELFQVMSLCLNSATLFLQQSY